MVLREATVGAPVTKAVEFIVVIGIVVVVVVMSEWV